MRSVWFMTLLMLSLGLAGCLDGPTVSTSGQGDTRAEELVLPTWEVGDQWLYTFTTPQFGEDSARLVVAEVDDENGLYRLGISNEREAQRHAVINHNPFLGRITMEGLSVYEQGEAQPVFNFPWEKGQTWSFTLFGQAWTASTVSIYNGVVDVLADSEDGHRLMYAFNGREGFLDSLVWTMMPTPNNCECPSPSHEPATKATSISTKLEICWTAPTSKTTTTSTILSLTAVTLTAMNGTCSSGIWTLTLQEAARGH